MISNKRRKQTLEYIRTDSLIRIFAHRHFLKAPFMKRMKNPTLHILEDEGLGLTNYFMALRDKGYLAIGAQNKNDA